MLIASFDPLHSSRLRSSSRQEGLPAMPIYQGPHSDHFDGAHFFDPNGAPPKRLRDVLRWQGTRRGAKWPRWHPSPYSDVPPQRVEGAAVRFSFVGHASWLIQTGGLNILIDPIWSRRASPFSFVGPKRVNDPGIAFDALPPIDVVLVSHGHYDHLDLATLSRLAAKFSPRVVTPLGNDLTMCAHDRHIRAEAFDWGDRIALGNDVAVSLVPTRHCRRAGCSIATKSCGRVLSWKRLPARSMRSVIQAMAMARIFAACVNCTVRCASRCCRSAHTNRAGLCVTSI